MKKYHNYTTVAGMKTSWNWGKFGKDILLLPFRAHSLYPGSTKKMFSLTSIHVWLCYLRKGTKPNVALESMSFVQYQGHCQIHHVHSLDGLHGLQLVPALLLSPTCQWVQVPLTVSWTPSEEIVLLIKMNILICPMQMSEQTEQFQLFERKNFTIIP